MTTTTANGRLCNQIIRNIAVSLIAEKANLFVSYVNHSRIRQLGIPLFVGQRTHSETKPLTDENYLSILQQANDLSYNLDPNSNYFQTKEIIDLIYQYLHTPFICSMVKSVNPYRERYQNNNDLFIHIRLTDAIQNNPGLRYYLKGIQQIIDTKYKIDTIYIASDQPHHPMISHIIRQYPNSILYYKDEIDTIQFGSTCKYLLLSGGTFSSTIGYLAYHSNVYYPEYDQNRMWHGDIFSIDSWNKIHLYSDK